ncbi:hypothetical protein ACUN9V_15150 [Salinicola sp. V024]|uniref:hypothetical protein n=1 Tax=unclassified Salinicola TaxID=2634022 RepID=UPI00094E4154|nr:hypothetical protein [Salinicola sp. MH3R3-1]OLO06404.1 hypothetical protein BTW08_17600 [Salinicola sp. MH3R3-1]
MPLTRTLTATRWSTLLGLGLVMLLSLPRYWFLHDTPRLTLLLILAAAIVVALIGFWRVMGPEARSRCPGAIKHLATCLLGGIVLIMVWRWFDTAADHWAVVLSQGAALGLLLHVVARIWRRR